MTFLSDPYVRTALALGALVSVVAGPVGVLTVMRRQSFAAHALSDTGAAGGSAAYLAGVDVVAGFISFNVLAAALLGASGSRRRDDLGTGVVLGGALGLAALFLHLQTTTSTSGGAVTVLFGSLFTVAPSTVGVAAALAAATLGVLIASLRAVLLTGLSPDLARVAAGRSGHGSAAYLAALAGAASLAALTTGSILATALLIGPAAAAVRLFRSPAAAIAAATGLCLLAVEAGVALSYASYSWPPAHRGWPVSFLVVAMVAAIYVAAGRCSAR